MDQPALPGLQQEFHFKSASVQLLIAQYREMKSVHLGRCVACAAARAKHKRMAAFVKHALVNLSTTRQLKVLHRAGLRSC
jgi:hypothetical protein